MSNDKRIVIEYNGWISVAKEDLKIQTITENDLVDVDTTNLTVEEIVSLLEKGKTVIKSFGETYLNDAIDGEDNFTFSVDED